MMPLPMLKCLMSCDIMSATMVCSFSALHALVITGLLDWTVENKAEILPDNIIYYVY